MYLQARGLSPAFAAGAASAEHGQGRDILREAAEAAAVALDDESFGEYGAGGPALYDDPVMSIDETDL